MLINHVTNFDNLTLNDLPDVGDHPSIYDFDGNKIFVGKGKIVEYDFKSNSYIRMSDRNVLNCGYTTERFGNHLYSSCNLSQKFPSNSNLTYGQVFKIDLVSGRLVKKYFPDYEDVTTEMSRSDLIAALDKGEGRLINPYLASKDSILWISSWDGVVKMDTRTEQMESINNEEIFGNGCYPSGVFNDDGKITVTAVSSAICSGAVSVLDESSNSWKPQYFGTNLSQSYQKYNAYMKEKGFFEFKEPEVTMPNFYFISPVHKGKYYLVASDGVYTLERNSFPEKSFEQKISELESGFNTRGIFTKDDNYFVLVVPTQYGGGDSEITYGIAGYMIDFNNDSFRNLTPDNQITQEKQEKLNSLIKDSVFSEDTGKVYLTDSSSGEVLIAVDFLTKKLHIGQ